MAAAKIETDDGLCCPICLEQFNMPRQLPCAHSFCEKCLQSHITTEAAKVEKLRYVKCPVCRNSASPSIKDRPTSEWATLFPVSSALQSILPSKSKVNRLCDACNNEGVDAPAEGFCIVCGEAMCIDCLKVHRKLKIAKDHTIISVGELACNPRNVIKLAEGFICSEHHGEDIVYYCTDHSVPCRDKCFFDSHKICSKVIVLKKDLPALLCDSSSEEIIADVKKNELLVQRFKEINVADLGKVVTTTSSNIKPLACSQWQTKYCEVESVDVIDLEVPTGITPWFTGLTYLPEDGVMLADHHNKQCILLSSSYHFITSYPLTAQPWNICVLDDREVAVSFYNQKKIQILSVIGDTIRPVRRILTKYYCNGIAAAGKGEMVLNGYHGDNKCQWSLINTRGDVKCTHQYESPACYLNYIALNNMKTRVYVNVHAMNSLLCFDMDGKKLFTYSPDNLKEPRGIAVDKYDNIYVLGSGPDNIHQLLPDGSVVRVVNTGVTHCQWVICIHQSKDILIIMNGSETTKLHIYQLK